MEKLENHKETHQFVSEDAVEPKLDLLVVSSSKHTEEKSGLRGCGGARARSVGCIILKAF